MGAILRALQLSCKVAGCVVTLASGRPAAALMKAACGGIALGVAGQAIRGLVKNVRNIKVRLAAEADNVGLPRHFRIRSHPTDDAWVDDGGDKPLEIKLDEVIYVTTSKAYRRWCDELLLEFPVVRADDGSYATMAAFLREKLTEAGWWKRNMADFIPRVIACTYLDTRRTLTRRELAKRDPGRLFEWFTGAQAHPRWKK